MKSNFILIFFFLLVSCESKFSKQEKIIKEILQTYRGSSKLSKKVYLIFVDTGCGACVKITSDFIKDHIDLSEIEFIVSSNSSKDINMRFTPDIRQSSNFIADDKFISKGMMGIYPKVLFVEDQKIIVEIEINYGNANSIFKLILETVEGGLLPMR
jgi:thioredoxin-related protein